MHLPKATRRRLVYAAATVLVTGGLVYTWKQAQTPEVPQPVAAADLIGPVIPGGRHLEIDGESMPPTAVAASIAKVEKTDVAPKPKVSTYKVVSGDTIEAIAARFGLETSTLLYANAMSSDDLLQIDQELTIPSVDGIVHEIRQNDTLWEIAEKYGVSEEDVIKANPEMDPSAIQPGQLVLVPGGKPAPRRTMVASRSDSGRSGSRKFEFWPASGPLTDSFGWRVHPVYGGSSFHDGMDMGLATGTPLRAVAGGTVTMASRYGGYGLTVRIDHGGGLVTQYAHMSQIDVGVGQEVGAGEHIGYSGNTGVSTGPHLHFMVIVNGSPSDPMGYLP